VSTFPAEYGNNWVTEDVDISFLLPADTNRMCVNVAASETQKYSLKEM
jgi:hypothetical protein